MSSMRLNERTEVRRNRYKVAVDADEGRRRREDNMVEIRKNKREESLMKRREGMQPQPLQTLASVAAASSVMLENLPAMVANLWSDDGSLQLEATTQFRKLLSIERMPPIDEVKQAGVVPHFVQFLVREDFTELQFEAAWDLTNVASGTSDHTKVVIYHGAIPMFVKLLGSPSDDVSLLLTVMHLDVFCVCLLEVIKRALKRKLVGLSQISLLETRIRSSHAVIEAGIFGPLNHLLQTVEFEVKKEAAWAISNATSGGTHEQIRFLVNQGCIKSLCDLLICPDARVVTVCLEGLENILKVGEADKVQGNTGGDNPFAQLIDEAEGLEKIKNLQSHDNTEIYEKAVKILETYWMEDDEEEVTPPGDVPQQGFNFGGTGNIAPINGFHFG